MQSLMKRGMAEIEPHVQRLLREESGASSIKYALLASCIAVAIAATVNSVGTNLRDNFYRKLADSMPG